MSEFARVVDIDAMAVVDLRDLAARYRQRAEIDSCPEYNLIAERHDALARAIERGADNRGLTHEVLNLVRQLDAIADKQGEIIRVTWAMASRSLHDIAERLGAMELATCPGPAAQLPEGGLPDNVVPLGFEAAPEPDGDAA